MLDFRNYEDEILRIASEQKVDVGVAFDKFRADVACGAANSFNTGDTLRGFDFAGVKKLWDAMTESEKSAAVSEYRRNQKHRR